MQRMISAVLAASMSLISDKGTHLITGKAARV